MADYSGENERTTVMYWAESCSQYNITTCMMDEINHYCLVCQKQPAMLVEYDDSEEGPYCKLHWIEFIINKFDEIKS